MTTPIIYGYKRTDENGNVQHLPISGGWTGGPIDFVGTVGDRSFMRFPNTDAVSAAAPSADLEFAEVTEEELAELGELPKYPA